MSRDRIDTWLAVIEAAPAAPSRDRGERVLMVNVGARQLVAQLHGHLLPVASVEELLGHVRSSTVVDFDSPAAVRAVLASAVIELQGCDRGLRGAVLVRCFNAPGDAQLLVCVAPRDGTR